MIIRSSFPVGEGPPLETSENDIIVMSDLHLSHPSSDQQAITKVINAPFKKVILNGDILDSRYVKDLDAVDEDIIRKLEDLENEGRVVAIGGNHEMWIRTSRYTCLKFKDIGMRCDMCGAAIVCSRNLKNVNFPHVSYDAKDFLFCQ